MFQRLLLAAAFLAAIQPFAKADRLNFTISDVCYCSGDPTQQPGYRSVSFDAYTYELYPQNASTGGNPNPTTYYSPNSYDNHFTWDGMPVTRTYVDFGGVTHTTTDNETVTISYDAPQLGNGGEYITLGGGGGDSFYPYFYTGTVVFGPGSGAVPTFSPGTYYDDDRSTVLQITDLTTAPTPEPSSMVLAGSGLLSSLGMVIRRRRTVA